MWACRAEKIATVCGCAKSTLQRGQTLLALEVNYKRDETLAAGLKYERTAAGEKLADGLRLPERNRQEGLSCSRRAEPCPLLLTTFSYIY